ncbi:hypothetical protein [Deinococcus sonorensis]|uniref:Uncharacterized protein n=1 Tax=Deinococcus sonorensis TaxID=309891 RepID=A0ABV8YAE3_9DEIO
MSEPPQPGTVYRMGRGSEPRYEVRRVVQEHPEYWEVELQGIHPPHALTRVVIVREYWLTRAV